MAEQDSILLRLQLDKRGQQDTIKGIQQVKGAVESVDESFEKMGALARISVASVRQGFDTLEASVDAERASIRQLVTAQERLGAARVEAARMAVTDNARFVDDLRDEIRLVEKAEESYEDLGRARTQSAPRQTPNAPDGEQVRGAVGDVSTTFGAAASVIGGSSSLGGGVAFAGDVAGFIEYIPLFNQGVRDIGRQLLNTGPITKTLTAAIAGIQAPAVAAAASIGLVTVALGVIAAAVAAIALAIDNFNKTTDGGRRAFEGALAAQQNYYSALESFTSEQVRAELDTLNRRRDILRQQIAETQGAVDSAGIFAPQELKDRLRDLQVSFEEANQTIGRFEQGLEGGTFAINDAIEAEKRLAEERARAALVTASDARSDAEEQIRWSRATADEIRNEIQARQDSIQVIQAELQSLLASGDQSEQTTQRIAALNEELREASDDTSRLVSEQLRLAQARDAEISAIQAQLSEIDRSIESRIQRETLLAEASVEQIEARQTALERERAAIEGELDALRQLAATNEEAAEKLAQYEQRLKDINDEAGNLNLARPVAALRELKDAAAEVAEISGEISRIQADSRAKIDQINAEARAQIEKAATDRDDALNQADQQAQQARLEARRKANADIEKAEVEHERNLEAIQRRFNRSFTQAVGDRDALAAKQAEIARDDELSTEKQNYDDRLKQIDDTLKEQNRQIDQRLREQTSATIRRYNEQVNAARQAAAASINAERQRVAQEIASRQQSLNQAQQYYNQLAQISASGYNTALAAANRFFSSLVSSVSSSAARPPSSSVFQAGVSTGQAVSNAIGSLGRVLGFANGGVARGTFVAGENGPELVRIGNQSARVYSASETARMGQGMSATFNLNFDGKSLKASSRAEAIKVIDELLTGIGMN